ncbi:hypothetical protein EYF80_013710 [Liparis tanakae]|uniref:Uncharacterized protein n=1 Tax=Liparis tanakae TaxID=230148 RepID=A0A4Z2IDG1_9TELE|nr:hypothetical protein EYF80_013710 [Liparis tanakae]
MTCRSAGHEPLSITSIEARRASRCDTSDGGRSVTAAPSKGNKPLRQPEPGPQAVNSPLFRSRFDPKRSRGTVPVLGEAACVGGNVFPLEPAERGKMAAGATRSERAAPAARVTSSHTRRSGKWEHWEVCGGTFDLTLI